MLDARSTKKVQFLKSSNLGREKIYKIIKHNDIVVYIK